MASTAPRKKLPRGFRRCTECNEVRHRVLFRTPHEGFGRCIFCWWSRFAWNDITSQSLLEDDYEPIRFPTPDLADLGYRPEHASFWICVRCASLYETSSPSALAQLCPCRGSAKRERWDGHDFNEKIHLCECCNARVLRSGSKFSVWFCDSCKFHVDPFNDYYHRTIVPIGRHSFMFNDGPAAGRPRKGETTAQWARRLHATTVGMSRSIEILKEHQRRELGVRLHAVGLPLDEDVPLGRYLELVVREDPRPSLTSFQRLSHHFAARVLAAD